MASPASAPQRPESLTFTERVGLTQRWGRYLTAIEQQAMDFALGLFSKPGDAFEAGCQGGRWSEMLVKKGWRVTATDVDEAILRGAQQRIPEAKCIPVRPGDRSLPAETASADLLLCIEVIPVMHSDWFQAEATRVLRPGGVLFGVFLNKRSMRGMFVLLREKLPFTKRRPKDGAFIYKKSYSEWKREFEQMGFEIQFERGFCWAPFARESDSVFVTPWVALERGLGLQRLPSLSPWVAFVARKKARP
jgi:SAM-dependent methyltransferase